MGDYSKRLLIAAVVIFVVAASAMVYKSVDDDGTRGDDLPNLEGGGSYDVSYDVIFSSNILDMRNGTFMVFVGVSNFKCPDGVVLDVNDVRLTNGSEEISHDPAKSAGGPGYIEYQVVPIDSPSKMVFLYFDNTMGWDVSEVSVKWLGEPSVDVYYDSI